MNEPAAERPAERPGPPDPSRAVRGAGAAALVGEALVLLLAIQPMRVLGADLSGATTLLIVTLAAACLVVTGLLKRGWAWRVPWAIQAALVVSGFATHASLSVLGLIFALVWGYVLRVRRSVLSQTGHP